MGSDDEDEAYDPSKGKKKTGPTINVKKNKWEIRDNIKLWHQPGVDFLQSK